MRSGYAPQTSAIPAGLVTVDGVPREVVAVSTVRELGGGGVPGVRGTAAAEGSVEWARLEASSSQPSRTPVTRLGNWPPAPGSTVQVTAGTESQMFPMLSGVLDSSQSDSDGVISSSLIDPVDRLHRRINLEALLYSMPPLDAGGTLRNVGVSSDWVADIILRRCAYFTTPYMAAGHSGVNVPGTGSMWPERGTCTAAGRYGEAGLAAQFLSAEWGWGIYNADASYTPDGTITAASQFTIACMISDVHSAQASVEVTEGAGKWILAVQSNKTINAHYNSTLVASLAPGVSRRVEMRVSAGSITLTTDDGRSVSGTHGAGSEVTTAAVSLVRIAAQAGARIGGVTVSDMAPGWFLNYGLNARIYAGTTLTPTLLAAPRVDARDALEVLGEIADATCRAFWWDEDGTFHWMPGDVLLGRAPSLTLTSQDSLLALGWSEALSDVFRRVNVDHKVPVIARSRTPNVMLWQGSGQSLDSGQMAEEIAAPPTDEEWIQTQWSPYLADSAGQYLSWLNLGRGSFWGGVRSNGTSTAWAHWTDSLTLSSQPIGNMAMKYTYQAGAIGAAETVELSMPNDQSTTAVWSRWRNEKLPILRGYGRVEWGDNVTTSGAGPETASDFDHDGGKWAQGVSGETPGRIAAFLAQWLCTPRFSATGVRVVHDPRIQVGDVVTVRDEHAHGIVLTVLITRVDQTVRAGEQDMVLDFFVIDAAAAWVTLGQHDAAQAGTLADHDLAQDGESLAEHDQDPAHLA